MNKSALTGGADECVEEGASLVSSSHIGCTVSVEGVGEGTLLYVGGIDGKSGLYCGIELDTPNGKHNGTFNGFAYFSCRTNRGIFAPLYKVRLVSDAHSSPAHQLPSSRTFLLQQQQQKLSRSALPSLPLRDVFTAAPSPMETSSTSSNILNHSYLMEGSWGGDDMMASGNTYILPRRRSGDDEEEDDLMRIRAPESILDRLVLDMPNDTSLVLDHSKIGVDKLPIIGSPARTVSVSESEDGEVEDALTPMADRRAPALLAHEHNGNGVVLLEGGGVSSCSSSSPPPEDPPASALTKTDHTPTVTTRSMARKMKATPASAPAATAAENAPRPKKDRAPLVPTSTPKFPVKTKAPSKSQLMMEKIKASLEAEKSGVKKTTRERVSLLPAATPTTVLPPPGEGVASSVASSSRPPSAASSSMPPDTAHTPSRTTRTKPPTPATTTPVTAREPRKPRVSLLPPVPAPAASTKKVAGKESEETKKTVNAPSSSAGTSRRLPPHAQANFPTSSFAPKVGVNGRKTVATNGKESARAAVTVDDAEKLRRLRRAVNGVNAMSLCYAWNEERWKGRVEKSAHDRHELLQRLAASQVAQRAELEAVHNANEKAIQGVRDELAKEWDSRELRAAQAAEEEKNRHEMEIAEITRRHQQSCALLDEKNVEAEKRIEELEKERKKLQTALANDRDTKVQTLSSEISSLNTALQLKSSEMKELRLRNEHLTQRVDEIPAKDLEVTKLKHKITDLKGQLDQRMEREKLLVQQNEELRRKERTSSAMAESFRKDVDVLKFQMGLASEEERDTAGVSSTYEYGTPVRLRMNGMRESGDSRPHSYSTLPHSARLSGLSGEEGGMTRSVIGAYSAGRSSIRTAALDRDVIYAPDQVIASKPRRLNYDTDDEEYEEGEDERSSMESPVLTPALTHT